MSTFGDDIRTISRYNELLQLIRSDKGTVNQVTKGAINGARGIAYGIGGSVRNVNVTSTPGGTKPVGPLPRKTDGDPTDTGNKDGTTGAVDGAKDALDAATDSGSSSDLNSGDNTNKDGWYDLQSLLDGAKDGLGKFPPSGDEVVNTLTGLQTDDETRNLIIHVRDAAVSFLAPDDRDGGLETVSDPDWDINYYYEGQSFADTLYESTFNRAGHVGAQSIIGYPITGGFVSQVVEIGGTPSPITGNGDYFIQYYVEGGISDGGPYNSVVLVFRHSCTSPGNPSNYCLLSAPDMPFSSDLGATQLGWVGLLSATIAPFFYGTLGRFIPNPYDINVPTQYADGSSILDIKTLSGDPVRIGPLRDGGWYVYYRDGSDLPLGDATANTVYTIGNNRTTNGFITPNQLATKLPI